MGRFQFYFNQINNMNIKNEVSNFERIIWLLIAVFLVTSLDRRESQIESLVSLNELNKANERIQSGQINDLSQHLLISKEEGFSQGFEEGKTQAMIASIHGKPMYDYADGYHAALSQFYSEDAPDEIKLQITNYINNLMDSDN